MSFGPSTTGNGMLPSVRNINATSLPSVYDKVKLDLETEKKKGSGLGTVANQSIANQWTLGV